MWTGIPDMESFPLSVEVAVTVGQSVHRVRHVDGNHAHDAWTVDDAMLPRGNPAPWLGDLSRRHRGHAEVARVCPLAGRIPAAVDACASSPRAGSLTVQAILAHQSPACPFDIVPAHHSFHSVAHPRISSEVRLCPDVCPTRAHSSVLWRTSVGQASRPPSSRSNWIGPD
jgi:hypothetical protein